MRPNGFVRCAARANRLDDEIRVAFSMHVARGNRLDEVEHLVLNYCRREIPFDLGFDSTGPILDVCIAPSIGRVFVLRQGEIYVLTEDGVTVKRMSVDKHIRSIRYLASKCHLYTGNPEIIVLSSDPVLAQIIPAHCGELDEESGNFLAIVQVGRIEFCSPNGRGIWTRCVPGASHLWVMKNKRELLVKTESRSVVICEWTPSGGCLVKEGIRFEHPVVAFDATDNTVFTCGDGRISVYDLPRRQMCAYWFAPSVGPSDSFHPVRFSDGELRIFLHMGAFSLETMTLLPVVLFPEPKAYSVAKF